ncbi:Ivy family c-type lysozyme inhibitor [Affinirhizobium pseudoryzae]|uniref:Ivy family c-type lysozyme inhibitor n=1 Tax=Allorhizobium pseudoryzae TaxID=379684 RepID=UPI0013EE11F4|nr:Ivy family c-type lysozyme inhibitor [Allorhizobium pseudoryzae]
MIARLLLAFLLLLPLQVFAAEAKSGRFLQEVISSSTAHEQSLRQLLQGERGLPSWVRNMLSRPRYVSGASQAVIVDGTAMELFAACLAKQCPDSHMRVLFLPDGKVVALRAADKILGEVVLGNPSAEALSQLRREGL